MNGKRIAILNAHVHRGDAVGHDTLEMCAVLRAAGHDARIFAPGADAGLPLRVEPMRNVRAFIQSPDDILLYHYTVAWEEPLQLFRELECRRIIKYHNVTPPEFFAPYHSGYADLCRRGRSMLREFTATRPDLMIGDSQYNVQDLIEAGADPERTAVVPPFHAIDELIETLDADLHMTARLSPDAFGAQRNVLMVGRVVPNKGHELLIRSFALYREFYDRHCRLIIAGKREVLLHGYTMHLRRLIERHELEDAVLFTDRISAEALKACYLTAHAFCMTSDHEGFCVPLIEAMAFGIPVLALDRGAVGETAGDGAIVWNEKDPALFAASLGRILGRDGEGDARELAERGRQRYHEHFTNRVIRERFLQVLEPFL